MLMGGSHNEFRFVNDSIPFSHQHAIRVLQNGNITLFDNGNFHTPSFSRAVEYKLDEATKSATLVWEYRNTRIRQIERFLPLPSLLHSVRVSYVTDPCSPIPF
jgi:hypothetical protein